MYSRCHLLPDKCPSKTAIGTFWRFQLVLFPSRERKSVGLGNLRPLVVILVANVVAMEMSLKENLVTLNQYSVESSSSTLCIHRYGGEGHDGTRLRLLTLYFSVKM
jgi:hypothetical protein